MLRLLAPAMLLGVFAWAAAPAAASHVSCGDTITKNTTLDSDLIDCPGPGTALTVIGDGITLDLNGHTIDGTGDLSTGIFAGVREVTAREVTIVNGAVRDFGIGIYGGLGTVVRRVAVSANSEFGILLTGRGRVERSTISHNLGGAGIALSDASGALIRKNVITGNAGGVALTESVNNRIEQNDVRANLIDGIALGAESDRNVVEGNVASGNGDDGIEINDDLEFGRDNVITRNIANDNGDLGIEALSPSAVDGGGNRAFGNGNPLQCLNIVCK